MTLALILAILFIVLLVAVFVISYVLNKKTPIPENCRDLFEEKKCEGCQIFECAFNKGIDQIKEEIKEEQK